MKFKTKNTVVEAFSQGDGYITLNTGSNLATIEDSIFEDLFEPLEEDKQETIRCLNCNVEFPFELFVKRKDVFDFCFCCGDLIKK